MTLYNLTPILLAILPIALFVSAWFFCCYLLNKSGGNEEAKKMKKQFQEIFLKNKIAFFFWFILVPIVFYNFNIIQDYKYYINNDLSFSQNKKIKNFIINNKKDIKFEIDSLGCGDYSLKFNKAELLFTDCRSSLSFSTINFIDDSYSFDNGNQFIILKKLFVEEVEKEKNENIKQKINKIFKK